MLSATDSPKSPNFVVDLEDDDNETASQRSISLSSPAVSPRESLTGPSTAKYTSFPAWTSDRRESRPFTIDTDLTSEPDNASFDTHDFRTRESSISSASASLYEESKSGTLPTYPPPPTGGDPGRESVTSFSSTSSKKARPESFLFDLREPLILGIALVDFNHLVGPKIEFSMGDVFDDEEVVKILPFLALPDGAHLSHEDYSYFHLVPATPNPTTVFGISCNRQIAASSLLVKDIDVTRSTVQKAVVILAAKPIFGLLRDRLGVITQALFSQRDFRETDILVDFYTSLESSVRSQLTESGLYMGTSLRELVHHFRQRTLVLLKALILQKKIMFYGHPVEKLCTYQYSLISLIPGLLHTLEDCGSPPLANRAPTLTRPTTLRTSNRTSLMNYLGLPLDLFGKDAFFQPYLPLQQLDMLKETKSWLCGCTNAIVTSQKVVDLLVNIETGHFEFRDPTLERVAGLTAADRKWMDEIVRDVNDGWDESDPTRPVGMQFKGSDDYLRSKFEEYISSALAAVKYADFLSKGESNGVIITGASAADSNAIQDYNPIWIAEFKKTNAYDVWQRVTDPTLFDIIEPRHPCNGKPSVVADLGLRLQEGIQELKLEQQLAPTREAISRTITAGSARFFGAVEGVRGRWAQRAASSSSVNSMTSPQSLTASAELPAIQDGGSNKSLPTSPNAAMPESPRAQSLSPAVAPVRPIAVTATQAATEAKAALGALGAGIGSFFSARASRFSSVPSFTSSRPVDPSQAAATPPVPTKETSVTPTTNPSSFSSPIFSAGGHSSSALSTGQSRQSLDSFRHKDSDSLHSGEGEPAGMAL
ncbi:hypothetical protein JAAARDRAFT_66359 [Jaapia argillacea MUCL 33604]|uniref:UDENN domain-containing protein n=1 Tax=Jaapia argillacea MUCL 33604 TaxID=933084 RepID=A0A067Q6L5_9AGAM|nr:hypothetical protein JAAARDRAFT_66359 [Jaapia argillacea MUCL 33604]